MRIKLLQDSSALRGFAGAAALSALVLALAGCETAPPPRPGPPPAAYAGPPPNTTVYAYPEHGQSADQQSRDRYECSLWAVHQTGFDPSAPNVPPEYRVVASGPPPGTGTAIGAIAGALLGAAISGPYDRGAGVVFGGLTGAMIGSASDASRVQQNEMQMSEQERQQAVAMAEKASDYRRALSACLSGRGYSVK
ncbi:MAG: glycine zipper 2TM domain-containing protein [Steroidobacteraceae bacterium]